MKPTTLTLAVLCLALLPAPSWAHALGATWTVRDGRLHVEAFYDDDSPAARAKVVLLDERGKELAGGTTDDKGLWQTSAPPPGSYKLRVDAGDGHLTESRVNLKESAPAQGPARAELTRYPWLKIMLGLGVIGIILAAFLLAKLVRGQNAAGPKEV